MKKILAVLLAVLSLCLTFAGCGGGQGDTPDAPTFYTVTFKQDGQADAKVSVESGKGLSQSQIPTPKPVDGYIVVWEDVDLTNITKDITVNAVLKSIADTGLKITLIYPEKLPENLITVREIDIKVGEEFNLPELIVDAEDGGYEILAWKTADGMEFPFSGTYMLTESITLTALVRGYLPIN